MFTQSGGTFRVRGRILISASLVASVGICSLTAKALYDLREAAYSSVIAANANIAAVRSSLNIRIPDPAYICRNPQSPVRQKFRLKPRGRPKGTPQRESSRVARSSPPSVSGYIRPPKRFRTSDMEVVPPQ